MTGPARLPNASIAAATGSCAFRSCWRTCTRLIEPSLIRHVSTPSSFITLCIFLEGLTSWSITLRSAVPAISAFTPTLPNNATVAAVSSMLNPNAEA